MHPSSPSRHNLCITWMQESQNLKRINYIHWHTGIWFFERFTMTISLLRAPDVVWVTSPHHYTTIIFEKFWWLVKLATTHLLAKLLYCYILLRFLFWPLTKVIKFELMCYFCCCAVCSNKWDQGGLIPLDFSKDQTGPKLFFGTMVTDFILT